jgi:hypothetical protein
VVGYRLSTHPNVCSLYAWESELATVIGADAKEVRSTMKALVKKLFQDYIDRKQNQESGPRLVWAK